MRENRIIKSKTESSSNKRVFISHSTKDAKIVNLFQDTILIGALTLKPTEIFNSSSPGMKVKIGTDWRRAIKKNLLDSELIFLIITPNYFECEVCLCEMGAAWTSEKTVIPLIPDTFSFEEIGVLIETSQVAVINNDESLDEIKDIIQRIFSISNDEIPTSRWSSKKSEFIMLFNSYLSKNRFLPPLNRDNFNKLLNEKREFEAILKEQLNEKAELKKYINELEHAKDKEQVIQIQKKLELTDELDVFYKKCKEINSVLKKFPSIINGIIFKDYCRADVIIQQTEGYTVDLEKYKSRNQIFITANSEGFEYEVNWNNREMKPIRSLLEEFDEFIQNKNLEDYIEIIENDLDVDFDFSSSDFWQKAFEISISFNY